MTKYKKKREYQKSQKEFKSQVLFNFYTIFFLILGITWKAKNNLKFTFLSELNKRIIFIHEF